MQYDFSLVGNGSQRLEVSGKFFKYKSGSGMIRVTTSKGGYVDLVPGQGVVGEDFSGLTVQDKSGAGNVGVLLAGQFDFRDDTITGTVSFTDGQANVTVAGKCFIGSARSYSNASLFTAAFLRNPVGSSVNIMVEAIWFTPGSGTNGMMLFSGPYTTGSGYPSRNKKAGGADGKGILFGTTVGNTGTVLSTMTSLGFAQLIEEDCATGIRQAIKLSEPLLIPPGYALAMCPNAASASIIGTFEFREEAA